MGFALLRQLGLSTANDEMTLFRGAIMLNFQEMAERDRAEDVALAVELLSRARAHGTLEAVVRTISPPVQRKRGRQLGSTSKTLSDRRVALWCAYEDEKLKLPNATDAEIARNLYAKGGRTYGNSPTAVAAQIAKMKALRNANLLMGGAGRSRKRGRPKKMANPN